MIVVEIAATRKPTVKAAQVFHPGVGAVRLANVVQVGSWWQFQPLPPWCDQLAPYQRIALGHVTDGGWATLEAMRSGSSAAVGMVVGWWLSGLLPRDALGVLRSYLVGGLIPEALACPHGQHGVWCDQCHPPLSMEDITDDGWADQ